MGSGLMGNYLLSKIMGYDGSFTNYLLAGGAGALAGGALGHQVTEKFNHYRSNPRAFNDLLAKIESSPALHKWHEWQKQSPLMKPVRRGVGRILTNIKGPKGYQMDQFRDTLKKLGPKGVMGAALKDERAWEDSRAIKKGDFDVHAREALWRGMFDLPSRERERQFGDFFQTVPGTEGKNVRFNPQTAEGKRLQRMAEGDFYGELNPEKTKSRASLMGGVAVKDTPEGYKVSDPWDVYTKSRRYKTEKGIRGAPGKAGATPEQQALRLKDERNHLLRNIADPLISNPVTIEHTFPKR